MTFKNKIMNKFKGQMLVILIISLISPTTVSSQNIEENIPIELNGLKISYKILNHTVKKIKNLEYERYKIKFEAKNISGSDIINLEGNIDETSFDFSSSKETSNDLVMFNCLNANGKRLTSKEIKLILKPYRISYKFKSYDKKGKEKNITKYITIANIIRNEETISNTAIFIVSKGDKPIISYSEL